MAERAMRSGQKVELTGKDVRGTIAFIGNTHFASGKWIGVVLDSPKGKNNGSIQGKTYFQCEENHGVFVRASQLTALDEHGQPIETKQSAAASPSFVLGPGGDFTPKARSRLPVPGTVSKGTSQTDIAELSVTSIKDTAQVSEASSKRASFVETGFVETLKPQYTPGPALSPGMGFNLDERLTNIQQSAEIDRLQGEIRDLNEKLETLRVKRSQDKEKLKEMDKMRLQLEQLLEFKARIMDSQAALQRDYARAKQETREAIEAKERHAEEMADLAETVEMATLDKEMAEEKAEALQMELDQANERIDSLTMDVELLKAEMSDIGAIGSDGDSGNKGRLSSASALEMKQLEQQNTKLRETLVRLRDLSAHEKHESQKLQKELELRRSEIAELSRTKEKLSARQEEMEQTLADLQDQVDAALGAEEMVENLTTKNLTLEERVKELEEAVADLEAIGDMNEQLQEGSRELELELREESDMAQAAKREAIRERDAALETLADRDQTIKKFRELVQRLQDQSQDLQDQLQRETSRPISALPEMIDFKKMFAESKAHTKAIDLELRRIDVQQSNQHVQYLTAYMPESFMTRGGDHDAMLLLLLLPRLLRKADIVVEQVRDKFPAVSTIDRAAVLRSHGVEQFAFCSRLSFWIYSLQGTLEQLLRALNTCTPDILLRVGVLYSDLALQERAIDGLVELLRHDQLDENASLEALERCVAFCHFVTASHLPPNTETVVPAQQMVASCRALSAACDDLHTEISSILVLMPGAQQESVGKVLHDMQSITDTLRQQLKQCRRRLTIGSIPAEHSIALATAQEHAGKLVRIIHECLRACTQHITASGDAEAGVAPAKAFEFLQSAIDQYIEGDVESMQSFRASLAVIESAVNSFAHAVHEGEYDTEVKREEKVTAPIILRAQCVKKELEETKMLRQKLEAREADIKELKKSLKLKQEELSEMVIRKDLAESKLGNVHKDYGLNMEKLQRKLDDCQMLLRRKEKEFEETMDHLQADIDSLESERGELKEKLKSISKKALIEGLAKSVASSSGSPGSPAISGGPSLPVTVRDSPMLVQQVQDLRLALRHAQNEALRNRVNTASNILTNLPSFKMGKKPMGSEKVETDNKTCELAKKTAILLKELQTTLANPTVVDISSRRPAEAPLLDKNAPGHQLSNKAATLHNLRTQVDTLQTVVLEHLIATKPGTQAQSSFAAFPTVAFAKALQEDKPQHLGHVSLKKASGNKDKQQSVPLLLDLAALRKLHTSITV